MKTKNKKQKRNDRHRRIRAVVKGTEFKPRLSVFRSNKNLWAQLIDDEKGGTLASASSLELKKEHKIAKIEPEKVGELLAQKAVAKKINNVVFDRGGYKYHGSIKMLAEGARKGGLKF